MTGETVRKRETADDEGGKIRGVLARRQEQGGPAMLAVGYSLSAISKTNPPNYAIFWPIASGR